MRRLAAVAIGLVAVGSCGAGKDTPEVAAVRQQLALISDGQYAGHWAELHPEQQAIIPKADYVTCAQKRYGGVKVSVKKVTDDFDADITIPGTDVNAASKAVTVELRVDGATKGTATVTYHEILVDGTWRWTTSDPASFNPATC